MSCPEPEKREAYLSGSLRADEQRAIGQHLASCAACAREAAWSTAMRLGLAGDAGPAGQAGADCLSDEDLCAFIDGALQPDRRAAALKHLLGCTHCLSDLIHLDRALEEAEQNPHPPPAAALNRAIRLGAPGRSASSAPDATKAAQRSWFDRIFGAPLPWRIGMAGAAAGLVLLLVVVLGGPSQTGPAGPKPSAANDGPRLAQGDEPDQRPRPLKPEPHPDQGDQGSNGASQDRPAPDRGPDRAPPRAARVADLGQMSPEARDRLAAQVAPQAAPPKALSGQALAAAGTGPFAQTYSLGRGVAFLERFGGQLQDSPRIRELAAATLGDMAQILAAAPDEDGSGAKLSAFARDLGQQIAPGQALSSATGPRLRVFIQAMTERLHKAPGAQLGSLVQAWKTSAALDSGSRPDAAELERARQLIRQAARMGEPGREAILQRLDRLGTQPAPAANRGARILDELVDLDQAVRRGP